MWSLDSSQQPVFYPVVPVSGQCADMFWLMTGGLCTTLYFFLRLRLFSNHRQSFIVKSLSLSIVIVCQSSIVNHHQSSKLFQSSVSIVTLQSSIALTLKPLLLHLTLQHRAHAPTNNKQESSAQIYRTLSTDVPPLTSLS